MRNTKSLREASHWSKLVPVILLISVMMLGFSGTCATKKKDKNTTSGNSAPAPVSPFGFVPLSDEEYQNLSQVSAAPMGIGASLPITADLSANMPIPGDQGNQGSCAAWAVGYALKSYQEQVERNWGLNIDGVPISNHVFSPAYIYNQQGVGRLTGMTIPAALELLESQGCATLATMSYNQNDWTTQPSLQAKTEASNYKIASYNPVTVNPPDLNSIKTLLSQGNPIVIGIHAGSNLMWPNIISPYIYSSLGDTDYGGHAVTLVGYDDTKGSNGAFKFINSWKNPDGTRWGDGGYAWIDYKFFFKVCLFSYHYEIYYAQDIVETTKTSSIYVNSDPTGAGVYLDGNYVGTAPLTIPAVSVGSHTVTVTKDGYKTQATVVAVTENQTTQIIIALASEVVSPPVQPFGSTSGITNTSYTYSTGLSSSNFGHTVEYQFDWKGDGTTDLSAWGSASQSKTWSSTGTYSVRARSRCATHTFAVSDWSYGLSVTISLPTETVSPPYQPTGPTSGNPSTSYNYSTGGASCNLGHSVQYQFDWKGDGVTDLSGWGSATQSKSWSSGTYSVRARARCSTNNSVISGWSSGLSVTISLTTETISTPPNQPSGPTSGNTGTSYNYSTGGASSSLGHSIQYYFDWGDGSNSGWLPVGTTSASKSWSSAGTYSVKAQARCATHTSVVSTLSSGLSVVISQTIIETVSPPNQPTGTTSGYAGTSYNYSTGGASSSLGHSIQYYFDWGDGSNSGWLAVGTTSASHSWSLGNTYIVKAKARCAVDTSVVSSWSSGLSVLMPTPPPTGSVAITVRGISTNPGPWSSTVKVKRYTTSWLFLDEVYADSNWVANFNNITTGQYYFEAYQLGAFGVYEYWTTGLYTVNASTTSYYTMNRSMPYVSAFAVYNNATGDPVGGTTVPLGTTLRYTITIYNPDGVTDNCRGKMYVNTSRTYNYSSPNYTTGSANISSGGPYTFVSWTYTPSTAGTYYHAAAAETYITTPTSSYYVTTDSTSFTTASYGWVTVAGSPTERITNGGFESGFTGWTASGSSYLSNLNPYQGGYSAGVNTAVDNTTGAVYQSVTIPSGATQANLSFYLKALSDEITTTSMYDYLYMEVLNTSGTVLQTLAIYSNLDKSGTTSQAGTWSQKSGFSLIAYKGQTVFLRFRATTDSSYPTIFRIDNVSLMADGN